MAEAKLQERQWRLLVSLRLGNTHITRSFILVPAELTNKIFGPKMEKLTGGFNKDLHYLFCLRIFLG
jgi:hypothetical protein